MLELHTGPCGRRSITWPDTTLNKFRIFNLSEIFWIFNKRVCYRMFSYISKLRPFKFRRNIAFKWSGIFFCPVSRKNQRNRLFHAYRFRELFSRILCETGRGSICLNQHPSQIMAEAWACKRKRKADHSADFLAFGGDCAIVLPARWCLVFKQTKQPSNNWYWSVIDFRWIIDTLKRKS